MKYTKNTVKCDLGSYIHLIRGQKKAGKSTLFRDLVLEEYGKAEGGLLISIGNETGAEALDELYEAKATNWKELTEIVEDLTENKADNEFQIIGLDTVDELIKIATAEVLRLHKITKGKPAESLNAAFGGYGAGRAKLVDLIDNMLADLKHAGYGIFLIGHTKLRDVKEKNGDEYQQLKSNLSEDYDGIFSNKADIIMTITVDKDIKDGNVVGTKRYMHFRDDGFIDCGARFVDMPEKVEYGAREYIDAFEQGVKSSMKTKLSDTEIKKRKKEEQEKRSNEADAFVEQKKNEKVDEEKNQKYIDSLLAYFQDLDDDQKKEKKDIVKAAKSDYDFGKFDELISYPTVQVEEIYNKITG